MTVEVKHTFVSAKGDGPDPTLVRPSNWNALHSLELAGPSLLGRITDDAGAAVEIPLGAGLNFTGGALVTTVKTIPVGTLVDYAGTSAPSGWLLCYGQTVSRTTYAALFTVLSTRYGAGNGTTTFNLPDLRGRVRAGKDDMGGDDAGRLTSFIDGDTLGAVGGHQGNTLDIANLPAHSHDGITSANGNHSHHLINIDEQNSDTPETTDTDGIAQRNTGASASTSYFLDGTATPATLAKSSTDGLHQHTVTTDPVGSGTSHENVQPTMILNTIIFTGV